MYPERIVCLTEETTEILYLLGEQDRIVGISGFTVRPPQARKEKPKVSAFTSARLDKILALKPDLVLGFSDLQADIAAQLVRQGLNVMIFNQRSVAEIFKMIRMVAALVGAGEKAEHWISNTKQEIQRLADDNDYHKLRPRIYFEEWHEPMISAIRWVSELIEMAGGEDCFSDLSRHAHAKDRIIANPEDVMARNPDIIIGSWCGRKFRPDHVRHRPGWEAINAVRDNQLFEIKSPDILQPGPAALTDGLHHLREIILRWRETRSA
jgi:iron complex transport system substrate-binding protein